MCGSTQPCYKVPGDLQVKNEQQESLVIVSSLAQIVRGTVKLMLGKTTGKNMFECTKSMLCISLVRVVMSALHGADMTALQHRSFAIALVDIAYWQ